MSRYKSQSPEIAKRNSELIADINNGATVECVAAKYGISPYTAQSICQAFGVSTIGKWKTRIQKHVTAIKLVDRQSRHTAIIADAKNGVTVEEMSAKYSLTRKTIELICYNHGLSLHGKWSSRKSIRKPMIPEDLVKWIESQCIKSDSGCMLWQRQVGWGGYGIISLNDRNILVHRYIFEFYNNVKLPRDIQVCHSCDVRNCVNINHLFSGTAAVNAADRDAKGRNVVTMGEDLPQSKLKVAQVIEIKKLLKSGESLSKIAKKYGVATMTIGAIRHGNNWKQVVLDEDKNING